MAHTKQIWHIVKVLKALGWTVRCNKHYVATPPGGGRPIVFSVSPSDRYGVRNLVKDFKKVGVDLSKYDY